jgi:hypothetical protein
MTFMISHAAIVDEKDLGPNTDAAARGMTRFDPAESWRKASIPRPGRHWTAPDLSRCQASPAARWKETVCLEPD